MKKVEAVEKKEQKVSDKVVATLSEKNEVMVFTEQEKKLYGTLLKGINMELRKVEKSYLNIAFKLNRIYQEKLYKLGDYQNIYDFAKGEYSLARGTCNNYINICTRFGYTDPETGICETLMDKYKEYSSSKLVVMVSMPNELIEKLNPKMTVREIKEMRRLYMDEKAAVEKQDDVPADETESECIQESLNLPERNDGLMDFAEGVNSVTLAEVEDIFKITDDTREVLLDAIGDFKAAHPQSKFRFAISLTW
ncbi:MAG: hypothetical protein ACLTL2_20070 [Blautia sp.]|uniref:hypothetical protein n=1 Tax=Blautia sp. TaxID=1955243 RepID=UPI0039968C18